MFLNLLCILFKMKEKNFIEHKEQEQIMLKINSYNYVTKAMIDLVLIGIELSDISKIVQGL